jgi:DNA-binding CsgD family transcriptional regulator
MVLDNIISLFFEGIDESHISDEPDDFNSASYLRGISDLSSLCIGSILVMDFKERCLSFVSDRDIFFCDASSKDAKQLEYTVFPKIVHNDDISLFIQIHKAILNSPYIVDEALQSRITYFYFTIRNKNFFRLHSKQHYLMICYKIKPVFINKKIRYGICSLTISGMLNPGNLRVYFNDTEKFDEYSLLSRRWKTLEGFHLDEYDKMTLRLVKQGLTDKQIAEEIGLSYERIRHRKSELCQKLGVKNMKQAIVVTSNHLMLFGRY